MELGTNIKQLRESKGLTQDDVVNKTGMKREYLSKIENNKHKNLTYKTLKNVIEVGLETSLGVFFSE